MRVLVAEDNRTNQLVFQKMVRDAQIELQFANTGIEAVEMYQSFAPDLIFMDIQLSDGLSFKIFRQVDIQTPVIFTTAYNEYALQAFKVNSIDYLLSIL
jgi:CheY-like chemotaxis protein